MLKSLIWKEFRELLPLCAVALAVPLMLIGYAVMGYQLNMPRSRFRPEDVWPLMYLAAFAFAIAIGLWQNWRESSHGTFQFLLQRPVTREGVFGAKFSYGAALCLIVGLGPIVGFTLWCESVADPSRRGPGVWEPLGGLAAGIWLLYAGAFLSSLRPGRWYGSRFLPLLAAIMLFILLQMLLSRLLFLAPPWHLTVLAIGPAVAIGFLAAALYAARTRDYS